MSNALSLSTSNATIPAAPKSRSQSTVHVATGALANGRPANRPPSSPISRLPSLPSPIPRDVPERLTIARERIRATAEAGQRLLAYEVALDLDLSEFYFARRFRMAFGRSPHVYYDEVRAAQARAYLREGLAEGEVARRVGLRRPAELRALLRKRPEPTSL